MQNDLLHQQRLLWELFKAWVNNHNQSDKDSQALEVNALYERLSRFLKTESKPVINHTSIMGTMRDSIDQEFPSVIHFITDVVGPERICSLAQQAGADGVKYADLLIVSKITELMSHITEKTIGHKLLIFSQFTSMLSLVRNELENQSISYAYLDGKTTPANRNKAVENFQNEEDISVFLISLKAGGVGLNLTAADYVYLLDPWWNPAKEAQAIDVVTG